MWDDGSGPLKYQPWAAGEPSQKAGFDCASVTLRDGLWHASGCFEKRPFVCTLPQVSSACPPPPSCPAPRHVYYCDDGWTIYKDHCYRVTASFNVTFWDARAECQEWSADLASIHSQGENDFIKGSSGLASPLFSHYLHLRFDAIQPTTGCLPAPRPISAFCMDRSNV